VVYILEVGMVWYGILGFNVPLDTLQVISEKQSSLYGMFALVQCTLDAGS